MTTRIERTFELIMENRPSRTGMHEFITKYSETKAFCTPPTPVVFMRLIFFIGSWLGKSVISETTTKAANYNQKLEKLMQELRDRPIADIRYGIKQIYEDLSSNCLACADRAD